MYKEHDSFQENSLKAKVIIVDTIKGNLIQQNTTTIGMSTDGTQAYLLPSGKYSSYHR
jgi:hypothetical protein